MFFVLPSHNSWQRTDCGTNRSYSDLGQILSFESIWMLWQRWLFFLIVLADWKNNDQLQTLSCNGIQKTTYPWDSKIMNVYSYCYAFNKKQNWKHCWQVYCFPPYWYDECYFNLLGWTYHFLKTILQPTELGMWLILLRNVPKFYIVRLIVPSLHGKQQSHFDY